MSSSFSWVSCEIGGLLIYTNHHFSKHPYLLARFLAIANTGIALLRSESPVKRKLRMEHLCNGYTTMIREQVPQKYRCSKCYADNIRDSHLRFRSQLLHGFLLPYSFQLLQRHSQRTGYCLPSIRKTDNLGLRSSGNTYSAATFRLHFQTAS